MKFLKFLRTNTNIISISLAALLHGGALGYMISDNTPAIIQPQTIRISFVAPSSFEDLSENNDKIAINKEIQEQKTAQTNKSKKSKINKIAKITNGVVHKDSKLQNAANSDPIFNAQYLDNPSPNYPDLAKRRRIQGKVFLIVVVNENGKANSIEVSQSSGFSVLDAEALKTVKNWSFVPAKKNGKFVQANVIVPIEFKLI